jgi:hypothetical protein
MIVSPSITSITFASRYDKPSRQLVFWLSAGFGISPAMVGVLSTDELQAVIIIRDSARGKYFQDFDI